MCRIVQVLILLFLFGIASLQAQTIERNDDNKLIVSYTDGSWRYFLPTDSLILQEEYKAFIASEVPATDVLVGESALTDTMTKTVETDTVETEVEKVQMTEEEELHLLNLTERRLMLTERLRRVESGYIQLDEKELRKANDELAAINLELARMTMKEEEHDHVVQEKVEEAKPKQYNRNQYLFDPIASEDRSKNCQVRQVVDEQTGRSTYFTESEILFQYTPEEARLVLGPSHFLEAHASIFKNDAQLFLTLEFFIRSEGLHSGFGSLNEGSRLKIEMINGKSLTLYNGVEDKGQRDAVDRMFYYKGYYLLDEDAVKLLSKEDMDAMRVNWSAGYQDYDIYLIDVLRNQLNCLEREIENK